MLSLSLSPLPSSLTHSTGTENPAEEEDRINVAVSDKCGGSYCITQRWIHKHDILAASKGVCSMITYIHILIYVCLSMGLSCDTKYRYTMFSIM